MKKKQLAPFTLKNLQYLNKKLRNIYLPLGGHDFIFILYETSRKLIFLSTHSPRLAAPSYTPKARKVYYS